MKHAVYDASIAVPAARTMGPRGLSKPEVNSFEDISKIRNRNDKSIVFLTDVDTTLRDFYWRYDRGLEPYDSVTKQPAMAMPAAEGLTDAEKAVISLYLEDYSYQEIAAITGLTESNVGVRLNRIKTKLKERLN